MRRLCRAAIQWVVTAATALSVLCGSSDAAAEVSPHREVLDLEEAGALLRVEPEVVRTLAETQRIPARRVGDVWRFSHAALLDWLRGEQFAATPRTAPAWSSGSEREKLEALACSELTTLTARGIAPDSQTRLAQAELSPKPQRSSPPPTVGERPAQSTAEEIALRDQRVILKRGDATVDVGVLYSRSEQSLLAPGVRVEQSSVGASLAFRYGLLDDLQITMRLPGVSRRTSTFVDATITGTTSTRSTHETYLGDATVSLLGVALREAVGRPNIIWSIDALVPTGPGDSGAGGGFVLSKSYDPAVIFAGFSYLYGLSVDPSSARRELAQHNFGLNLGYTYAVNENLALSTSLLGLYRNSSSADGAAIPPPNERYFLQFGMTWLLARGLFLEPAVALRVGGASPDLTFSLNLPYSF